MCTMFMNNKHSMLYLSVLNMETEYSIYKHKCEQTWQIHVGIYVFETVLNKM